MDSKNARLKRDSVREELAKMVMQEVARAANSGAADVTLTPSCRRVKAYQVRIRQTDADTSEDSWRIETFASANGPVTIDGLNPGTKYEFQARALGVLGWTDWSDSKIVFTE